MTISGVEDEFLLAAGLGMPCLVYVLREAPARQQKLQGLIQRAMNDLTVWFYDQPGNLRERVRDDITAVVSDRFVDQPLTNLNMVSPTEFLESLFAGSSRPYKRSVVEQDLVAALALTERLCVMGPLGGGKVRSPGATLSAAWLAVCRCSQTDWRRRDREGCQFPKECAGQANT